MKAELLAELLGWFLLINITVLAVSSIILVRWRADIAYFHYRLFDVKEKDLGRAYFQYLAQYKIAILVFNFAPYIAFKIMGY